MKSLTMVLSSVLTDVGDMCCVRTDRDLETVRARVKDEGDSFLTITLPAYCKSFERSLANGRIAASSFQGFKLDRKGLPLFLGGFLRQIFGSDGVLLDAPNVDSIIAIRQVTLLFSKLERECSDRRVRRAISSYVECDDEVKTRELPSDLVDLKKVFLVLFGDMLQSISDQIVGGLLMPKHGPGATADRLKGNRKWKQAEWPVRLDRSFPAEDYLLPSYRHWRDLSRVDFVEPGAERPVRVITVPKTLKTPRIIAIEPTAMQYAQQGLLNAISAYVRTDDLLSSCFGLDDQVPNRTLAQQGSLDGSKATLDLSEASDRVSNRLVFELTRPYRPFARALQDSRSKRADVPGYGIRRIAKFASMGSATCFPIEGMVFTAIAALGVLRGSALHLSPQSIRSVAKQVRVFGDDIIVPTRCATEVARTLHTFGMVVNENKSFWTGRFRESCGGDFYAGVDVSVHRFRQEIPHTSGDARGVAALFSFRNKCYVSGYWKTARLLDSHLESLRIPLPRVSRTSPVLGRVSFLGYETQRYDVNLHSPLVRGLKIVARPPASPLGESKALLKFFVLRRNEPLHEGHLEHLGRPNSVSTRVGWGSPF